jgi:hypothetical protein
LRNLIEAPRQRPGNFDSHLNERISGAQLALEFLDRLGAQLQTVRAGISRHLAQVRGAAKPSAGAADPDGVDALIQEVNACWSQRQVVTAGTLNCRLEYSPSGEARQNFTARGLEFGSLRANRSTEILNFSVGGRGHRSGSSVTVEPGLSNAAFVQRFDRALAPSGVRAAQSAAGALTFSVPEAAWLGVRDTFTIMGEGRRFSTGRFNRVHITPEASILQPEEWGSVDTAALRATRQEAFKAQGVVRQAREIVARGLADAGAYLGAEVAASGTAEALWCAEFIAAFAGSAGRPDFQSVASFAPALTGLNRHRAMTVLETTY